jgi:DNA invertase Pin-like site-specific DNA recombinase
VRVALYARVSTAQQSTDMQLRDLRAYCQGRFWEIVHEYIDEDQSGAKQSRPALDMLMADSRRGKFQAVLVWRFDRFARSLTHLLKALDEFQWHGIDFISHQENVDTSTPGGRLVFQIFGSIAEFERAILRERVKAGVRAARARGKRLGRPAKPVDLQTAYSFHRAGKSWNWIAGRLKISPRTLRRAMPSRLENYSLFE